MVKSNLKNGLFNFESIFFITSGSTLKIKYFPISEVLDSYDLLENCPKFST